MTHPADATVYIVDDDASVREALAWMLRTRRLANESFDSAEFLIRELAQHFVLVPALPNATPPSQTQPRFAAKYPSCLLLDIRLSGMSGLTLFNHLSECGLLETVPVIFLTGHADVATAVASVKRGAFDFFEKPFSNNLLVDRIEAALVQSQSAIARRKQSAAMTKKISDLTEREGAVLQLVVAGLANKVVADQLGISVRTVEVHRARVFEKMDVKSAVELANLMQSVQS